MACMVFEEAPEIQGTKVHWIMQNDIKGSIPKSILINRGIKGSRDLIEGA